MSTRHTIQLSAAEANAILAIEFGVDVYDQSLAAALRGMQQRGIAVKDTKGGKESSVRGPLFCICDPRAYHGDGTDQVPYFGAVATPIGVKIAHAVLEGMRFVPAEVAS